jgi:hypothetical protein
VVFRERVEIPLYGPYTVKRLTLDDISCGGRLQLERVEVGDVGVEGHLG